LANIEMRLAAVEGALMCLASALLTANQIKDLEDTASVIAAPDMVGGNVVELHPGARGTDEILVLVADLFRRARELRMVSDVNGSEAIPP